MDQNLHVFNAFHKVEINVKENGIKKAGVTLVSFMPIDNIMPTSTPVNEIENSINMIINKPFMFIIREKNTKDIWFTGTVYKPNIWKNNKKEYEY